MSHVESFKKYFHVDVDIMFPFFYLMRVASLVESQMFFLCLCLMFEEEPLIHTESVYSCLHVLGLSCRSLGLAIPPRIRFLQKERKKKEIKNQNQDKMDAQKILDMFTNTAKPLKGTKAAIPQTSTEPGESGSEEEESGSEEEESGSEEEESGSKEEESGSEENESSSDEDEKELAEVKNQKLKSFSFNIGDDDLDDILTVKKVGQIEEEEEDDEDIQSEVSVYYY